MARVICKGLGIVTDDTPHTVWQYYELSLTRKFLMMVLAFIFLLSG